MKEIEIYENRLYNWLVIFVERTFNDNRGNERNG